MKADAVVFTAPNEVVFSQVDCPEPEADDVVIDVKHSWISNGTEGSFLRGERIDGDTPYREGDPWPFPIIAGYQKVGVVDWVGENVTKCKAGDWVFGLFGQVEGLYDSRAGHVSPAITNQNQVWLLPEGVDPVAFSGLVLTQVGYNCGARCELQPGDGAIVIGDGLVGLWTAQTLVSRGAQVMLVGRHAYRLQKFIHEEPHSVVNSREENWIELAKERFPEGAQVGVDTVGSLKIMNDFFSVMKRGGHLVSAGFYGTEDALSLQPLRYKELTIQLPSGATGDRLDTTIDYIASGKLGTLPLITHRFPAAQASKAWDVIKAKSEEVLGVVLDW